MDIKVSQQGINQNRHTIRWYVMVFPSSGQAMITGLEQELKRRERDGEPLFEYFVPSFVEVKEVNGRLIDTRSTLFYNYLFVHASEAEIYRIKQRFPQYNFLPRVKDGKEEYHYPYLSDEAIRDLQWIARSYSDRIPVCAADPTWLVRGDKIRITQGRFKGIEARIIVQPHSRRKDIIVSIENWMWVPLLKVHPGEYEVIELSAERNHFYSHLNDERIQDRLHEALCRYHRGKTTEEDRLMASKVLLQYANLIFKSSVMRGKQYSLLLPAYTILENWIKREGLVQTIRVMLPAIKGEQLRALLFVTLYGCMDNNIYYRQAHAIVDPWQNESNLKKSKSRLIRRLIDYDRCLGHMNLIEKD